MFKISKNPTKYSQKCVHYIKHIHNKNSLEFFHLTQKFPPEQKIKYIRITGETLCFFNQCDEIK